MPKRWSDLRSLYSMPKTGSVLPTKSEVLPSRGQHVLQLGHVDVDEVAEREVLRRCAGTKLMLVAQDGALGQLRSRGAG